MKMRASKQAVEVSLLRIPLSQVIALDPHERYAYYMLGHFFNELNFLRKLLKFAIPTQDDIRPLRQQPEMGQTMFIFRLAAGKLFEAKLALNKEVLSAVLRRCFLPLVPDADTRLKEFNRSTEKAKWLAGLRNEHSFHYPPYEQWGAIVKPADDWVDDDIFMSSEVHSGNVFYAGSDVLAQHWMFGRMNCDSPREAVDPMINALIDFLGQFTSLVEDILGAFVATRLLPPDTRALPVGSVVSPRFESVQLPFWTNMPKSNGRPKVP
jgi:hypothetical protein